MCGIVGYTGSEQALPLLLDGLRRLEYRGYDSSGVALHSRRKLRTWKRAGRLAALERALADGNHANVKSHCGIGHTRWATHGEPNDENAHPHLDTQLRIAIVHNGIIENAPELRAVAEAAGANLVSQTDTEVLAHLIAQHLDAADSSSLIDAVRTVLLQVQGTYGIAVLDREQPELIIAARQGSPVLLGIGEGAMLVASDMAALVRHTREAVHLDDGEIAELRPDGFSVTTLDAAPLEKTSTPMTDIMREYDRGGQAHYLYREIIDQPEVMRRTLGGRLDHRFSTTKLGGLNLEPRDLLGISRIKILGCGSALYAAMAGAQMIESLARLPTDAESAAEFRYRNPVIDSTTLYIAVSQSGETFDTLAAVREIRRKGGIVLGVVNAVGSSIAREVDGGVYMHAGPEVSVASTKAYTSMLCVFALLAVLFGRIRDISPQHGAALVKALDNLPEALQRTLELEPTIKLIAERYASAHSAFFVGRTLAYPIALEGAQKLKEVSYIHAEAYPASELKHGPLALVTTATPCYVVLPDTDLLPKAIASLEEIKARKGPVIALTDADSDRIDTLADAVIRVPAVDDLLKPVVMAVPFQLLAYHTALALGRDVDKPRNLAKSVTVE